MKAMKTLLVGATCAAVATVPALVTPPRRDAQPDSANSDATANLKIMMLHGEQCRIVDCTSFRVSTTIRRRSAPRLWQASSTTSLPQLERTRPRCLGKRREPAAMMPAANQLRFGDGAGGNDSRCAAPGLLP